MDKVSRNSPFERISTLRLRTRPLTIKGTPSGYHTGLTPRSNFRHRFQKVRAHRVVGQEDDIFAPHMSEREFGRVGIGERVIAAHVVDLPVRQFLHNPGRFVG